MPPSHWSDLAISSKKYIELVERCSKQMSLEVCSGCDHCGLRCAQGAPCTHEEWQAIVSHIAGLPRDQQDYIRAVELQDKSVSLGDDVSVTMCRFRDMSGGRCSVYSARPLICRLLGHVEWLPCPIEKVPRRIHTPDALELMREYAAMERNTFEHWLERENEPANQDCPVPVAQR